MIETLEVLLREYELNSIDNNNSYTVKNRNAKKRDAPTSENLSPVPEQSASGSPEAFDPRLGAFMAHLGVPNLQPAPSEPKPSSSESHLRPQLLPSLSLLAQRILQNACQRWFWQKENTLAVVILPT